MERQIYHVCNTCGTIHNVIPKGARVWIDEGQLIGWVWECSCHSTMFEKAKTLILEAA